jgi:hypothetical protein
MAEGIGPLREDSCHRPLIGLIGETLTIVFASVDQTSLPLLKPSGTHSHDRSLARLSQP